MRQGFRAVQDRSRAQENRCRAARDRFSMAGNRCAALPDRRRRTQNLSPTVRDRCLGARRARVSYHQRPADAEAGMSGRLMVHSDRTMLHVRDIAAAAERWMPIEDFLSFTHIRGKSNTHLAEPDGFDNRTQRYAQRRHPLPLDGFVHGDFLTLDYCGHGPWAILESHDSIADAEKAILGGAGILNGWTDFMIAFINGRPRDFEVQDESGRTLAKGGALLVSASEAHQADRSRCRIIWMNE